MDMSQTSISSNHKIDYINLAKGIVIFLVIWVHAPCPNWLTADLVNCFFFFISGFFFKRYSFGDFMTKQFNGLLIPFGFFYILSYPFRIIVHLWDNRSLDNFDWGCLLDIFKSLPEADYLFVNVPLWFIMAIFFVRLYYWFLTYLPKWVLLLLSIIILMTREEIFNISTPFMINNAVYFLAYFMLGNILKPYLFALIGKVKTRIMLIILALLLMLVYNLYADKIDFPVIIYPLYLICFSIVVISICAFLDSKKFMDPLRFLGNNTLSVLGYHVMILIFFNRIAFKLLGASLPWAGFICSVLTALVLFFIIGFSNKYIPGLVGKKGIINNTKI